MITHNINNQSLLLLLFARIQQVHKQQVHKQPFTTLVTTLVTVVDTLITNSPMQEVVLHISEILL